MSLRNFLFLFTVLAFIRLNAQNCSNPPTVLQNGDFPATGTGNLNSASDVTIPYWWASHSKPYVMQQNAPRSQGASIYLSAYAGMSRGIYSCFKFEKGKNYRLRYWYKNATTQKVGRLVIMATGPFSTTTPPASDGRPPIPNAKQRLDNTNYYDSNWTEVDLAFTAQDDFSRILIYPEKSTSTHPSYDLNIDQIELSEIPPGMGLPMLKSSSKVVCEGEKVDLDVDLTLWDPSYIVSWYENTGNGPQLKESGTSKKYGFTAKTTVTWTVRITDPSDPSGNTFIEKDITITVLPAIELHHSGDTTICHGDTAVLVSDGSSCKHAQDHLRFTWTNAHTGQIVGFSKIIKVKPDIKTVYQIHLQDTLTGHYRTGLITVYVDSRFEVAQRPDTLVCRGSKVLLNADVFQCGKHTVYYNWRNLEGGPTLYGQSMEVQVDSTADYLVTALNQHGLMDTAIVHIGIKDGPSTMIIGPDSLCLGDTIHFELEAKDGSGNYQVTWYLPNGMEAGQGLKIRLANGINGFYTAKVDDGCALPHFDSTTVAFFPIPGAILTTDFQPGCAPVQLKALDKSYRHDAGKNQWIINNLHLIDSGDLDFTFRLAGNYKLSLVVTSGKSCRDTFKLEDTLKVYPVPNADFELSTDWEQLLIPVQVINKANNADSLMWDFSKGVWDYYMGKDTGILFTDTGYYSIYQIAYNTYGCVDTAYRFVKISPPFQYFIPNAFSPNNDEHNRVFKPHIEGVKTYDLYIYNRWGELIYSGTDGAWDGTSKGKALADDVFMYVINFTALKGQRQTVKGNVTLIR